MLSRQGCLFYLRQPTKPKDLAPLKAVSSSNERLTPKLVTAVWRLTVNFNTPLATPTCHVKEALQTLQNMKVSLLTFRSLTHFCSA